MRPIHPFLTFMLATSLSFVALPARAQNMPLNGFQVGRYQPTAAGEWSFSVDRPWYSSTRLLAAGLTLDYGHNPLLLGLTNFDGSGLSQSQAVIAHQLIGHLDLAVSFADRVNLALTLPITFVETGTAQPLGNVLPQGAGAGDPRLGAMVRLYGQADESPVSIHVGAQIFIPLHTEDDPNPSTRSDQGLRLLPKLVLAGYGHRVRWAFTSGLLYRPLSQLGSPDPASVTAGSELQLGASLYYADKERRFAVGPEAVLATLISPTKIFQQGSTSLELLLGAHYHLAKQVMIGVAGGVGILHQPGTPDGRFLLRIAYAPLSRPARHCDLPEPMKKDTPVVDRDHDGVPDNQDLCPDLGASLHPDPARPGCPLSDQDGDGFFDNEDLCTGVPAGAHPDPLKKGCPVSDQDGDGIFDHEDKCPGTPAGPYPDPQRAGCPVADSDGDGIVDSEDLCPSVSAKDKPDLERKGCPLSDRDGDGVADARDACPDVPGTPSSDPKRNGCPSLVEVTQGELKIKQAVFFVAFQASILPESIPLLQAVAQTLRENPLIKKIEVQGHTDNAGALNRNMDLSQRRADKVVQFLAANGVERTRLVGKGYGPTRPLVANKTLAAREQNRRVQFVILDPPPTGNPEK